MCRPLPSRHNNKLPEPIQAIVAIVLLILLIHKIISPLEMYDFIIRALLTFLCGFVILKMPYVNSANTVVQALVTALIYIGIHNSLLYFSPSETHTQPHVDPLTSTTNLEIELLQQQVDSLLREREEYISSLLPGERKQNLDVTLRLSDTLVTKENYYDLERECDDLKKALDKLKSKANNKTLDHEN